MKSAEALGYSQASLRDDGEILVALPKDGRTPVPLLKCALLPCVGCHDLFAKAVTGQASPLRITKENSPLEVASRSTPAHRSCVPWPESSATAKNNNRIYTTLRTQSARGD